MDEFNVETAAVLDQGGVEYSAVDAAMPLEELMAALEAMKEEGVTHVLMASGNYRGAQWQRMTADWSWASEA
jgi:2-iminoacetate synthase ThiH